jgi:hypothetical protein
MLFGINGLAQVRVCAGVAVRAFSVDQVLRCRQLAGCWLLYSWEGYKGLLFSKKRIRIHILIRLFYFWRLSGLTQDG